jgi:hypothetical protein
MVCLVEAVMLEMCMSAVWLFTPTDTKICQSSSHDILTPATQMFVMG